MPNLRAIAAALALTVPCVPLGGCGSEPPGAASGASRAPSSPNVILYLIDTLRADHLGAYGHSRPTSPYIDDLAASGVVFDPAYSQDSKTLGSVASLLTSLHVPSHGITKFGHRIAPDVVTLAEALGPAGYETGSFITNVNAGRLPNLDRGFDHFHDAIKSYHDRDALRTLPEKALFAWIDGLGDRPFFAYVHTAEPHRPYIPPPPYGRMFDPDYRGTVTGYFKGAHGYGRASDAVDVNHVSALYDGEIRFADDAVRRLLDGLAVRGLHERTVLILTSDHGEELHDRGGWNHGHSLYDELIRVPLIFAGPGIPAGRRITQPVQLVDVAPTILEIAKAPVPESFEGQSLWAQIQGGDRAGVAARDVFSMTTRAPHQISVVRGRWKAIRKGDGSLELYDLASDPRERDDRSKQEAELAASLRRSIEDWQEARPLRASRGDVVLEREHEERLRTLGYIE